MNSKGFTLVEILITMFIMVVVVGLTVPVYQSTVKGIGAVSDSEEAKLDNLLAMEMIRLDLQHVGTGIGLNETTAPIAYVEGVSLDLRSTLINTNQSTLGWGLLSCVIGPAPNLITNANYIVDQREITVPMNKNLVLLDSNMNYITNITAAAYNCPDSATSGFPDGTTVLYTAFPNSGIPAANACAAGVGFCTNIRYNLMALPAENTTCAQGTFNLGRAVGNAAGGDPLVNCVAGFRVRFDVDADVSGTIVAPGETDLQIVPGNAALIMAQVRNLDMYILVQIGKEDSALNSQPTLKINDAVPLLIVDFTAELGAGGTVTNPQNYRWKIYKVSGKPNSWL